MGADGAEHAACNASADAHCGWASRTPYEVDGRGVAGGGGVDELGFVANDGAVLAEVATWRAMIVPVLHTTGVNTKVSRRAKTLRNVCLRSLMQVHHVHIRHLRTCLIRCTPH